MPEKTPFMILEKPRKKAASAELQEVLELAFDVAKRRKAPVGVKAVHKGFFLTQPGTGRYDVHPDGKVFENA